MRLGVFGGFGPIGVGVIGGRRKRRPKRPMDPARHAMMQPTVGDAIKVAIIHRHQKKHLGYH